MNGNSILTPDQLASAGRALYGERWQTSLAHDLDVADRTMRRWLAGETPIPNDVKKEVRDLLIVHMNEIDDLIQYSRDGSTRFEYFSDTALQELEARHSELPHKSRQLMERYASRIYTNPQAREYAMHGLSRRVGTLVRCIDNIFRILPPDAVGLPTREALLDAEINIRAFVASAFGALDNLAWIWVSERGVTKPNGSPLSRLQIGLGEDCTHVRLSFSAAMQTYLAGRNPWFKHLKDFRDALAHRIPLFILPHIVPDANKAAYEALDARMYGPGSDLDEYECLNAEQLELVVFVPVMKHTLFDEAPPVVFHSQVLCDFLTIEEIAYKLLDEI